MVLSHWAAYSLCFMQRSSQIWLSWGISDTVLYAWKKSLCLVYHLFGCESCLGSAVKTNLTSSLIGWWIFLSLNISICDIRITINKLYIAID